MQLVVLAAWSRWIAWLPAACTDKVCLLEWERFPVETCPDLSNSMWSCVFRWPHFSYWHYCHLCIFVLSSLKLLLWALLSLKHYCVIFLLFPFHMLGLEFGSSSTLNTIHTELILFILYSIFKYLKKELGHYIQKQDYFVLFMSCNIHRITQQVKKNKKTTLVEKIKSRERKSKYGHWSITTWFHGQFKLYAVFFYLQDSKTVKSTKCDLGV